MRVRLPVLDITKLIWMSVLSAGFMVLLPTVAEAAGGAAPAESSLTMVVASILCVGAAYIAANYIVDGLQRRFLILSGFEYFAVGVLLGPEVPQIEVLKELNGMFPIIALASGWVGLLRGMELEIRRLSEAPHGSTRLALVHSVLVGTSVSCGAYYLLASGVFGLEAEQKLAAICAGALGTCAITGSTGPTSLLKRRYEVSGDTALLLRRAVRLGDLIAIATMGVLGSVYHQNAGQSDFHLRPTEWAVISVGLGFCLGLLFTPFLGGDESPNSRFLALVGIITFAGGAAYALRLPVLLVCLALGVTLVNTTRSGSIIRSTLENTERPMTLVLLVLAGAMFKPPPWIDTLLVFGAYICARWMFSWVASAVASVGTDMRWDLFRGRLSHGEVTIAIAVGLQLLYDGDLVNLTYAVLMASVFLHDLLGPRVLRSLLVDVGSIRREAADS